MQLELLLLQTVGCWPRGTSGNAYCRLRQGCWPRGTSGNAYGRAHPRRLLAHGHQRQRHQGVPPPSCWPIGTSGNAREGDPLKNARLYACAAATDAVVAGVRLRPLRCTAPGGCECVTHANDPRKDRRQPIAPRQRGSECMAHLEQFAVVVAASVDALHRARW